MQQDHKDNATSGPSPPRLFHTTFLVAQAMLESTEQAKRKKVPPKEWPEFWGLSLQDQLGIGPGTMYPILARLRNCGWLTDRWEDRLDAPRRFYRVDPKVGIPALRDYVKRYRKRRPEEKH